MDGEAIFIRDGEITRVPTLSEPEWLDFPGLGRLEADVTSGGTSTAAWTYLGKLQRFENKVLRYPGHLEWLRAFKTLGLFSEQPVEVDGQRVIPRHVYHTLLEPQLSSEDKRDICVMRAVGNGLKAGEMVTVTVDLVDRYDEITGFTAMERLTGWHASVMMGFQARGRVEAGPSRSSWLSPHQSLWRRYANGAFNSRCAEPGGRKRSEMATSNSRRSNLSLRSSAEQPRDEKEHA